MKKSPSPPRLFQLFFRWFCKPELCNHIEGDLLELYNQRVTLDGIRKANILFIIDVLLLFRPGIIHLSAYKRHRHSYSPTMVKNYFKIAWRTMLRHKASSLINILGLSMGISACLIIFLVIRFEFSYDRFHPDKERIFRITGTLQHLNGDKFTCGCVPNPTASALRQNIAGFETVAGFYVYDAKTSILVEGGPAKEFEMAKSEIDNNIIITEPQYFQIFKYQWLAGDAAVALAEPFKVVLSEKEARRYFAETPLEDIMGRQVVYNDSLRLTVSGIVKDWTENSDFDFKDFISASTIEKSFLKNNISVGQWSNWDISYQVFAKLGENVQPKQLAGVFEVFSKNYLKPDVAKPSIGMQSLSGIHFNNEIADEFSRKASLPTLYGLMAIAIFILVIAAINFINLSTAQSVQRAKEIGIRKVLGSSRGNLVFQFLSETFLFTVFAVLIAVTMINPLLKLFYTFIPAGVQFRPGMQTLAFLAGITLIVSLLAGFYPAKVLSSYLPVLSLKGANASNTNQKGYLRKSLIVFQFTVSLVFIIGTLTVGNQINFMLNKDLGFKKEAIINIQTDWKEPVSKRDLFIQQIRSLPAVSMTSISQKPAAVTMQNGTVVQYNGKQKTEVETQNIMADENFLPLYGIRLLAGSNYAHSDTINQLLVNETATKSLGFKKPEDAIGKSLFIGISDRPNSSQVFPITGVMADFHSTSLHDPIKPLFIAPGLSMAREISIKLSFAKDPAKLKATLMSLEKTWKQIYPNKAFEYHFFDESIARFYDKEQKTAQVINIAMAIAIFISCMGLFGLVAFTTAQRTKEIGIRKILGASVSGIATMICKDFVVLVLLAILIASPVAWYFMSKWLQNFPYHISVSWWIFPVAGLMAITIALLTVGFQAIKASVANPVNSLRTE